jgi:hypothetical protein
MVSPIVNVAEWALSLRQAVFSPFTGRRCRQADEGQRGLMSLGTTFSLRRSSNHIISMRQTADDS